MQPPETEPAIWPSSRTATTEPTGRGAEPQVRVIVPSTTPRPSASQPATWRKTFKSTLSIDILPWLSRKASAKRCGGPGEHTLIRPSLQRRGWLALTPVWHQDETRPCRDLYQHDAPTLGM